MHIRRKFTPSDLKNKSTIVCIQEDSPLGYDVDTVKQLTYGKILVRINEAKDVVIYYILYVL